MIEYEDECVGCPPEMGCLGNSCRYKNVKHLYCDKCNADFYQSPKRLINEHIYGCNCCTTKLWTNEEFLANLGEKCLQEYEILSPYVNTDTKIRFKHKICGTEFEQTPYNFIYKSHKQYCPICYYKKSKGEVIIAQFLNNN